MSTIKQIPQQKLLQILQSCKQIPKDDRLMLRKLLKQGDQVLKSILADYNNKKIQIRIRKYIQKIKQGKKDQNCNIRQMTQHDGKGNKQDLAQFYCRMASKSVQKSHAVRINTNNLKQFKQNLQKFRTLRNSNSQTSLHKPINSLNNISNRLSPKSDIKINMQPNIQINAYPKYKISDMYLKQENTSLFTPVELLKWEPTKTTITFNSNTNCNSIINSNINYNSYSNSAITTPTSYPNPNYKPPQIQQLFKKIRQSVASITSIQQHQLPQSKQSRQQKNIYNLKTILLKHYAEDIFDHIIKTHFSTCSSINQKSIYLPYRQFLIQLQKYLKGKGENIQIIKQNQLSIILLQPFTNQYQSINTKNLGIFLNKFCLHKNNSIRNIFILLNCTDLDQNDLNTISIQKFKKINSWKGQQLIQAFEKIVKKWGDNNCISYWQMYRVKDQEQYINFNTLYTRL